MTSVTSGGVGVFDVGVFGLAAAEASLRKLLGELFRDAVIIYGRPEM